MRGRLIAAASALTVACGGTEKTPLPPHSRPIEIAAIGATVLVAAGDIGVCGKSGDERTAQLADSILRVYSAAKVNAAVLTLGDNAYPAGLDMNFVRCFGTSWGDPSKRLLRAMHPSIGNHDYQSQQGAAYYRYFGSRAGPRFKGYYSFDLGEWHAIALNSEIIALGSDAQVKAQEDWLAHDLATNTRRCTVAFFHRPAFSSGAHGSSAVMLGLWKMLASSGVDLILNGHDHHYERFLPQNAAAEPDTLNGVTEIIVGTGGGPLSGVGSQAARNSARRIQGHWGILVLTLGADGFQSAFLDVDANVWDSYGRRCH